MSNYAYQCCCGAAGNCPESCGFASSYTVNGVVGQYIFEKQQALYNCGQVCLFRSYRIEVNWTQIGAIVLTRSSTILNPPCCYRGNGMLLVTGTVFIKDEYIGGICPDETEQRTYTFTRDVPFSITVECAGPNSACSFSVASGKSWIHTLHICDFLVTCSDSGLQGDCDTCVSASGPFALRCVGGKVSYLSAMVGLNAITASGCRGYYGGSQCNGYPYPAMIANSGIYGPFAIVTDEECSGQDEYQSCTLPTTLNGFLPTRVDFSALSTPWLIDVDIETKSFCGATNRAVGPNANCQVIYYQLGCTGGIPWTYA